MATLTKGELKQLVNWCNQFLDKKTTEDDFFERMKDGVTLFHIVNKSKGLNLQIPKPTPHSLFEKKENLDYLFNGREKDLGLHDAVDAFEIIKGSEMAILPIFSQCAPVKLVRRHSMMGPPPTTKDIVQWVHNHTSGKIPLIAQGERFGKLWEDGENLALLIQTFDPSYRTQGTSPEEKITHALKAIVNIFDQPAYFDPITMAEGKVSDMTLAFYFSHLKEKLLAAKPLAPSAPVLTKVSLPDKAIDPDVPAKPTQEDVEYAIIHGFPKVLHAKVLVMKAPAPGLHIPQLPKTPTAKTAKGPVFSTSTIADESLPSATEYNFGLANHATLGDLKEKLQKTIGKKVESTLAHPQGVSDDKRLLVTYDLKIPFFLTTQKRPLEKQWRRAIRAEDADELPFFEVFDDNKGEATDLATSSWFSEDVRDGLGAPTEVAGEEIDLIFKNPLKVRTEKKEEKRDQLIFLGNLRAALAKLARIPYSKVHILDSKFEKDQIRVSVLLQTEKEKEKKKGTKKKGEKKLTVAKKIAQALGKYKVTDELKPELQNFIIPLRHITDFKEVGRKEAKVRIVSREEEISRLINLHTLPLEEECKLKGYNSWFLDAAKCTLDLEKNPTYEGIDRDCLIALHLYARKYTIRTDLDVAIKSTICSFDHLKDCLTLLHYIRKGFSFLSFVPTANKKLKLEIPVRALGGGDIDVISVFKENKLIRFFGFLNFVVPEEKEEKKKAAAPADSGDVATSPVTSPPAFDPFKSFYPTAPSPSPTPTSGETKSPWESSYTPPGSGTAAVPTLDEDDPSDIIHLQSSWIYDLGAFHNSDLRYVAPLFSTFKITSVSPKVQLDHLESPRPQLLFIDFHPAQTTIIKNSCCNYLLSLGIAFETYGVSASSVDIKTLVDTRPRLFQRDLSGFRILISSKPGDQERVTEFLRVLRETYKFPVVICDDQAYKGHSYPSSSSPPITAVYSNSYSRKLQSFIAFRQDVPTEEKMPSFSKLKCKVGVSEFDVDANPNMLLSEFQNKVLSKVQGYDDDKNKPATKPTTEIKKTNEIILSCNKLTLSKFHWQLQNFSLTSDSVINVQGVQQFGFKVGHLVPIETKTTPTSPTTSKVTGLKNMLGAENTAKLSISKEIKELKCPFSLKTKKPKVKEEKKSVKLTDLMSSMYKSGIGAEEKKDLYVSSLGLASVSAVKKQMEEQKEEVEEEKKEDEVEEEKGITHIDLDNGFQVVPITEKPIMHLHLENEFDTFTPEAEDNFRELMAEELQVPKDAIEIMTKQPGSTKLTVFVNASKYGFSKAVAFVNSVSEVAKQNTFQKKELQTMFHFKNAEVINFDSPALETAKGTDVDKIAAMTDSKKWLNERATKIRESLEHSLKESQLELVLDDIMLIFNDGLLQEWEKHPDWDKEENCRIVYHATEQFTDVFKNGFDPKLKDEKESRFGDGYYFTTEPEYALEPRINSTTALLPGKQYTLVGSYVNLGRQYKVSTPLGKTPIKPDFDSHIAYVSSAAPHDLLVGEEASTPLKYTEIVVKEKTRVLPRFFVRLTYIGKFIVWRDPKISNIENSGIMNRLQENGTVYAATSTEQVVNLLKKKKNFNSAFIVTNGGDNGEGLVKTVREELKIETQALVFCGNVKAHKKWGDNYNAVKVTASAADVLLFTWKVFSDIPAQSLPDFVGPKIKILSKVNGHSLDITSEEAGSELTHCPFSSKATQKFRLQLHEDATSYKIFTHCDKVLEVRGDKIVQADEKKNLDAQKFKVEILSDWTSIIQTESDDRSVGVPDREEDPSIRLSKFLGFANQKWLFYVCDK